MEKHKVKKIVNSFWESLKETSLSDSRIPDILMTELEKDLLKGINDKYAPEYVKYYYPGKLFGFSSERVVLKYILIDYDSLSIEKRFIESDGEKLR